MAQWRCRIRFPSLVFQRRRIAARRVQRNVSLCCLALALSLIEIDVNVNTCTIEKYQRIMIHALKEVQGDENIVGFYQTTSVPLRQSLVEAQAADHERLRHGGIVIVHGMLDLPVIINELTIRGYTIEILNLSFRPSAGQPWHRILPRLPTNTKFLSCAQTEKVYDTKVIVYFSMYITPRFTVIFSLIENKLTFSSIFEELPVTIRASALASAFINTLTAPMCSSRQFPSQTTSAPLPPDFSHLDLGLPSALNKNLEQVVESLEAYRNEENNVAYLSRQIAREKARADAHIARRKEDNAIRIAQGMPPLPEEDISRLFKVPPEPSRLESMLLLGQVAASARNVEEVTSAGLVKIYAANPAAV